jgi:histidyl-tRNA synthetase
VAIGDAGRQQARRVAAELRREGFSTDLDHDDRGLKAQFRAANNAAAKRVVVIGEKEMESRRYTVKEMSSGDETQVPFDEIARSLAERR